MLSGALEVHPDKAAAYREAFPAMLRLLKALYDTGVTIIPGTDALAGYALHHEIELYVRAGIPAAEVLRMSTLTPALVMGVNKDRGVITAGKLADMVLVDGDPTKNIRDLRNITTVIKGGKVYDPAANRKSARHCTASHGTVEAPRCLPSQNLTSDFRLCNFSFRLSTCRNASAPSTNSDPRSAFAIADQINRKCRESQTDPD